MEQAFRRGIIDRIATSMENACEHADVIIFATPVNTTVAIMQQANEWKLKEGVILTDTGSTKGPIMDAVKINELEDHHI